MRAIAGWWASAFLVASNDPPVIAAITNRIIVPDSTVTVPIYGKLADLYGRKPVFLIATAVFMVTAILTVAIARHVVGG